MMSKLKKHVSNLAFPEIHLSIVTKEKDAKFVHQNWK